jgi:hypothetical protein
MQAEFDALQRNRTWTLVDRPPEVRILSGKWVFKYKLCSNGSLELDLSISRAGPGSGRAEKNSGFSGRENPAHDRPMGHAGPQFSGRVRTGPGLGWAARAFYSVK